MKVFKFGGASIKDAAAIKNVGNILQNYQDESLLIVISAMGKTTNALEKVVEAHMAQNATAVNLLEGIKQQHYQIIAELFDENDEIYSSVNDTFVEIDWVIEDQPEDAFDYIYDQIVSIGELVSSKIVAAYFNKIGLKTHWLDARDIIQTDNLHREATVNWTDTKARAVSLVQPLVGNDGFVLTQGFIGSTSENYTTTLGREGSDYTAAIFSYCLDAESMWIWKDVPGVLTADPRLFDNVTKLERLSYREAIEMTYYGAKVIHPKTIKPLQNKSIPLYVKSFLQPEEAGTYISAEIDDKYPPMVAIEPKQALLHISTLDFSFVAEQHLQFLFSQFAKHRLQVNMMQNTAISFGVCVNDIDERVEHFIKNIEAEFKVILDRDLELITVRHYNTDIIEQLKKGKMVMLEQRLRKTLQMVVKDVPMMVRK